MLLKTETNLKIHNCQEQVWSDMPKHCMWSKRLKMHKHIDDIKPKRFLFTMTYSQLPIVRIFPIMHQLTKMPQDVQSSQSYTNLTKQPRSWQKCARKPTSRSAILLGCATLTRAHQSAATKSLSSNAPSPPRDVK